MNVGNHQDKNVVSGSNLCRHDRSMSAKCADIWLLGRHVANMSATFPAKGFNRLSKIWQNKCDGSRMRMDPCAYPHHLKYA